MNTLCFRQKEKVKYDYKWDSKGNSNIKRIEDYNFVINILAICTLGNKGNINTDRVQIVKDNVINTVVTELIKAKGNNWGIKFYKKKRVILVSIYIYLFIYA